MDPASQQETQLEVEEDGGVDAATQLEEEDSMYDSGTLQFSEDQHEGAAESTQLLMSPDPMSGSWNVNAVIGTDSPWGGPDIASQSHSQSGRQGGNSANAHGPAAGGGRGRKRGAERGAAAAVSVGLVSSLEEVQTPEVRVRKRKKRCRGGEDKLKEVGSEQLITEAKRAETPAHIEAKKEKTTVKKPASMAHLTVKQLKAAITAKRVAIPKVMVGVLFILNSSSAAR